MERKMWVKGVQSQQPASAYNIILWWFSQDEAEGGLRNEGEGEDEVEGHQDVEVESEGEMHEVEPDPAESEGEREPSSEEVDVGDEREVSEAKEADSDEKEDYAPRVPTSRRHEIIESGSERSEGQHYADNEDEEVDQDRSLRLFSFLSLSYF